MSEPGGERHWIDREREASGTF